MPLFVTLLLLSLVMGIASVAAGFVPLALTLTEQRIRQISSLGIGILVGTSMIVIIPEGVETLYGVQVVATNRQCIGLSVSAGFALMFIIDKVPSLITLWHGSSMRSSGINASPIPLTDTPQPHAGGHGESGDIGDRLEDDLNAIDELDYEFAMNVNRETPRDSGGASAGSTSSVSTMVGLVIHAFADGIALGASVASNNGALELIVFFAIMIHKAPASFGLSTVLLRDQSISSVRVRLNLFIFAAAAPIGAIVTYLFILILGAGSSESINWWTAILLLFSGGTFLYVAMHVMQELNNQKSDGSIQAEVQYFMLALIGMVLPTLTLYIPDV